MERRRVNWIVLPPGVKPSAHIRGIIKRTKFDCENRSYEELEKLYRETNGGSRGLTYNLLGFVIM